MTLSIPPIFRTSLIQTIQRHILPFLEELSILVTTGKIRNIRGGQFINKSIHDESKVVTESAKECDSFPPYPLAIIGATGGLVNGSPIVCGGAPMEDYEMNDNATKNCYIYDFTIGNWRFLCDMIIARAHHRAVVVDYEGGALWITGGMDNGLLLSTTELVFPNGTVRWGPSLPEAIGGYCMVTLPNGRIMLLGGYSDPDRVQFYDQKLNYLFKGPPMPFAMDDMKYNFACTVFNSPLHHNRSVVLVTGGRALGVERKSSRSSLIFDYTYQYLWENGKYLLDYVISCHINA